MSPERYDQISFGCKEALENLYLYLDSELDQVNTERVRAHLDECNGCTSSYEFERKLKNVVKERLDEDVPDAVVARLRDALHHEAGRLP